MHILIIGASRGLGLEFVSQYRAAGAAVTATARDEAALQRIQALGAKALRLDVADAASASGRAVCVALHPGWVRTDMGGAGADLAVPDAVADMRRTLAALQPADNGGFFNHDGRALAR